MEELESKIMSRTVTEEVNQVMTAFTAYTIREIVQISNEEGIKKEDIVSLLKDNGQFILVYFK